MPNDKEVKKALDSKRQEILKFDYWSCKLCDDKIDAGSKVGSDDEKTSILVNHIHTNHFDSQDVDPNLSDEHLVLYFRGHSGNEPHVNEKLI